MAKASLTKRFHDFCKKQSPRKRYDYGDATACALARFAKTIGKTWHDLGSFQRGTKKGNVLDAFANMEPHTFGALTKRLAKQIKNPRPSDEILESVYGPMSLRVLHEQRDTA